MVVFVYKDIYRTNIFMPTFKYLFFCMLLLIKKTQNSFDEYLKKKQFKVVKLGMQAESTLEQILKNIRDQVIAQEQALLQEVMCYERILNKQLSSDQKSRQRQIHEQRKEKQEVKKQAKEELQKQEQLMNLLSTADQKLQQSSQALNNQKPASSKKQLPTTTVSSATTVSSIQKPTNFHYRGQPPVPPKAATTVLPKVARMTIKQEQRLAAQKRTQAILKEQEDFRSRKDEVAGKITESKSISKPSSNTNIGSSKSMDKTAIISPPPAPMPVPAAIPQKNIPPSPAPPTRITSQQTKTEVSKSPPPTATTQQPVPQTLISFRHSQQTLLNYFEKEASTTQKIPSIKPYLQSYAKQELGYRQQENKYRLKFLHSLARYAPQKRKLVLECTDTTPIRGWVGNDYAAILKKGMEVFAQNTEQHEAAMNNKKTKALTLYKLFHTAQKIKKGYQMLKQEMGTIQAPELLPLKIRLPNGRIKRAGTASSQPNLNTIEPHYMSKDQYLLPFYQALKPKLQHYLAIKNTMKKHELKQLTQLMSIVLTDNKRIFTVIDKNQIQRYQNNIVLN